MEAADALVEVAGEADDIIYLHNTNIVAIQTDLTIVDLSSLQEDSRKRTAELAERHVAKGYPSQEDLMSNKEVLRFYTGFSSFTVLIAFFKLVFIPEGGATKLSKFDYFIFMLTKLCLSAGNFDLGF